MAWLLAGQRIESLCCDTLSDTHGDVRSPSTQPNLNGKLLCQPLAGPAVDLVGPQVFLSGEPVLCCVLPCFERLA